jgi:hypothetical protein
MKMKYKIFILSFSILLYCPLLAQNTNSRKNSVGFGFGFSKTDRRTDFYDGRIGLEVLRYIRADNPPFEYDYFINYNRLLLHTRRIDLKVGVGTLIHVNYFKHVVSLIHFDNPSFPLYTNHIYRKYSLSVPLELSLSLFEWRNNHIKASLLSNNNIAIFKSVRVFKDSDFKLTKWFFEPSDFELYTGLGIDFKRIGFRVQYRLYNLAMQDNAIGNDGKKSDTFNPTKFRLSTSVFF